ncbi:MAG: helix-turn-helix domain-containing protein [Candidatus Acidiferrum sp.]
MAKGNFGERLKREREMREVSLQEVTASTRIGPRFLEALENEQWDRLPGGVFNRGFVRAIARYLGLDEEGLLAEYDMARGEQKIEAPAPYENRIPSPPKWIPALAILVILAVVAGLFYGGRYAWRRYSAHRGAQRSSASSNTVHAEQGSSPSSLETSASPASSTGASGSPVSTDAALNLIVSTSGATRVRILGDGNVLLDAELPAGENRHLTANEEFEVTAADSSAVLLELNGQVMRPLGAPGSSGTITLTQKDLRQAPGGTSQP